MEDATREGKIVAGCCPLGSKRSPKSELETPKPDTQAGGIIHSHVQEQLSLGNVAGNEEDEKQKIQGIA